MQSTADTDKQKSADLTEQLNKATTQSTALSKQLTELQGQKKTLEEQLAALKNSSGSDKQKSAELIGQLNKAAEQSAALTAELAGLKLQKKEQEQQLARLQSAAEADKKKSAELTEQLNKANAQSTALSKQLADLQAQKKSQDELLANLKGSSGSDKLKSVELTEKLSKTTAEMAAISQQLAESKQASATLNNELEALKKQKLEMDNVLKSERLKAEIAASQLKDAQTVISSQQALLAMHKSEPGATKEKTTGLAGKMETTDKEFASLKKQLDEVKAENAELVQKAQSQTKSVEELTLANQKLKAEQAASLPAHQAAAKRVSVDGKSSEDTRASYAVGTWYGDNAAREKERMSKLGKQFDLSAFMQGFTDKVNNKVQLPQDKLAVELSGLDKIQKKQLSQARLENDKQSKAILSKAAKEKGAVKLPSGAVYRIIEQGEAPLVTVKNNIITELDEVLGTGKVMSSKEVRASRVQDLPPLFQTVVKKLGLGGVATIHIPASQAYGEQGVPGFVPPGTISIITVKIIGIK